MYHNWFPGSIKPYIELMNNYILSGIWKRPILGITILVECMPDYFVEHSAY